jgi:hypothetical protein
MVPAPLILDRDMSKNTLGWMALGLVVAGALMWILRELAAADNAMSAQGWIALVLGTIGTAAVAGVLMWLLFQSNRRGYDR